MARYRIAWLPGDGVGPEVMDAARLVLDRLELDAEYLPGDIGWECWCREGDPLPTRTIELFNNTDCAMFGAATSKPREQAENDLIPPLRGKGFTYRSPIVRARQLLELYICLRPCRAFPGNPLNIRDDVDLVVFRENTEDLYAGVEFTGIPAPLRCLEGMDGVEPDAAVSLKIITRRACDRIIRSAFEFARTQNLKRVTAAHKAGVLRATDGLFLEVAHEVARQYNDIAFEAMNVDACCMTLVRRPHHFKVIVAPNFYGDIVSDIAAELIGGLGFGCTGNIGRHYAIFEPTHGSAPRYAGQQRVNPIATILAAKMMLNWIGEHARAAALQNAVAAVVAEGKTRTQDMGGKASTTEMAQAVADKL